MLRATSAQLLASCDLALPEFAILFHSLIHEGFENDRLPHSLLAYIPPICPPDTPNQQRITPEDLTLAFQPP
jgi:hypothetical protein